ncbi:hypothetical protein G5B88_04195 [Herbaspirillum seropedicae]|nr:hypothetical protein [Herbaspirillum seropedicae]UMU20420.1 hypothetical protein G5B88_04195 [Herbaspirillum seropedicae]
MVSALSTKSQTLYDARVEYSELAARKIREDVPKKQYILSGSLKEYAKRGPNENQWVERYCNLIVAKAGLKPLIETADKELAAIGTQWWTEQRMLDHIGEQLDGFTALRTIPDACRRLYERIDMEAVLAEAHRHSGIKQSNAELRSYREEKQDCKASLLRLQSQLDALSNPPAASERSRTKDKRSQRSEAPSRSELHRQKKSLRTRIEARQADIAALDNMLAETQRKLDEQYAALAPKQLELATLIGALAAAGMAEEEQMAITGLLRQLDDYTERHDKTTSLLDHGNMPPFIQPTGEIVFSAGPHSAQQLQDLLDHVSDELKVAKQLLETELDRLDLHVKDGSEQRRGRIAPRRSHYRLEQLNSIYAHPDLQHLQLQGQDDAADLPGALRFSRVAASLPAPEERDEELLPEAEHGHENANEQGTEKGKEKTLPAPALLHPREEDDESSEDEARDGLDDGPAQRLLTAPAPAVSDALVPFADAASLTVSAPQALRKPEPSAAGVIQVRDLATVAPPPNRLPAVETFSVQPASIMSGMRLALMAPPAPEPAPEPVAAATIAVLPTRRTERTKAASGSVSRTSGKTKPSAEASKKDSSKAAEKVSKSSSSIEPAKVAAPLNAVEPQAASTSVLLLPEPEERTGVYHFGSADLDWDWQEMTVEFRVPAPLPQAPQDAIELATLRDNGRQRTISDTAYEEPQAIPAPTPAVTAEQASSSYGFTARELREQGRSATLPDLRTPAADTAADAPPPQRRATAPQTKDEKTHASANANANAGVQAAPQAQATSAQSPPAGAQAMPPPPLYYAVPVPVQVPVAMPVAVPVAVPAFVLPPDPRVPWWATGTIDALPPTMRFALMQAAMRNEYCTSVWHMDMSYPSSGKVKLYYVVRDNIPATSSFQLSPPGTPNPIVYTVHPGNPYCHVMEILPPRPVYAPAPEFPQAPPPQPRSMPSARAADPGASAGIFTHPSTDPRSPRYVDPKRTGAFQTESPPESARRPRARADRPSFDTRPAAARADERAGPSSRHSRSHRYGREQARTNTSTKAKTSGTSGRKTREAPTPDEFWEEQARHRSHTSRSKHSRHDRQAREEREQKQDRRERRGPREGVHQPQAGYQADMRPSQVEVDVEEEPIIIDIAAIDVGSHAPLQVLGTALPKEARARALKEELELRAKEGLPPPRHPEREVPLTDEQVNNAIDKMLNDPGDLNNPDFKDAKPSLARAEAIVNALTEMGFDLGRLNDLHVDLGYLWNKGERDTRRAQLGLVSDISKVEPPPAFAAAFAALCDRLMENERKANAQQYDKMTPQAREAALAAKRAEFEAADHAPYMDYLRQRYAKVFSFEMDQPMLKAMWTRVRHKLSTKVNELAAAAVTGSATFQAYGQAQRQRLQHHLSLQKNGLSEAGIDSDPGFRKVFDERLEQKLRALAQSEPEKMSTPEKRQAQRSNLSNMLLGSEGLALHEQYLLESEFGAVLRPVKQQLAANTWTSVMHRLASDIEVSP